MLTADIGEVELQTLLTNKDCKSTSQSIKRSENFFRKFLEQQNVETEFARFVKPVLNDSLRDFFASVGNKSGESLKVSSHQNIKYGLMGFAECMQILKATLTDMKKHGHGSVDHKTLLQVTIKKKTM
jgi:hypothetical protein